MSLIEYHEATTNELIALKNKVRDLVHHWPEEGRYKELALKNVIRRFLPEKYSIGTGFIIKQQEEFGTHLSSKQIDLIVYENSSPLLFKEGDFVMLTPDSVKGIIEVKTNIENQGLSTILRQANENAEFIFTGRLNHHENFFNGVFSYEGYDYLCDFEKFKNDFLQGKTQLKSSLFSKYTVNHLCLNKNWFLKRWKGEKKPHSLYEINNQAFPFFISNLVDHLSGSSVQRNRFIWYATDKELNLKIKF